MNLQLQPTWNESLDFLRSLLQQTQKIKAIALMITRMIRRAAQTNSPAHSPKVGPLGGHTEQPSSEDSTVYKKSREHIMTEPHMEWKWSINSSCATTSVTQYRDMHKQQSKQSPSLVPFLQISKMTAHSRCVCIQTTNEGQWCYST